MTCDVVVVAPHPDDETLGPGGTLLKHLAAGDSVHWLVVTGITNALGVPAERVQRRSEEIEAVAAAYPFTSVHRLEVPTTTLDAVPLRDLVDRLQVVFGQLRPTDLYLPFPGDAHSDHAVAFEAAVACTKWFRLASLQRVSCYETPSETDFALNPTESAFRPNVFVDVTPQLDRKIEIMRTYDGEMGEFPFPRSEKALRSRAAVHGAAIGCEAAEAFLLLREKR